MAQLYKNDLPLLTAGSKSILVLTVSDYEDIYQDGEGANYDSGATYYILETGEIRKGNVIYGGNLMIELTKAQYNTLVGEGEVTIDGTTITYSDDAVYFVTDENFEGITTLETISDYSDLYSGVTTGYDANTIYLIEENGAIYRNNIQYGGGLSLVILSGNPIGKEAEYEGKYGIYVNDTLYQSGKPLYKKGHVYYSDGTSWTDVTVANEKIVYTLNMLSDTLPIEEGEYSVAFDPYLAQQWLPSDIASEVNTDDMDEDAIIELGLPVGFAVMTVIPKKINAKKALLRLEVVVTYAPPGTREPKRYSRLGYIDNSDAIVWLDEPSTSSGTVDSALDSTSENPVLNAIVTLAINAKLPLLTAGDGITIVNDIISASPRGYELLTPDNGNYSAGYLQCNDEYGDDGDATGTVNDWTSVKGVIFTFADDNDYYKSPVGVDGETQWKLAVTNSTSVTPDYDARTVTNRRKTFTIMKDPGNDILRGSISVGPMGDRQVSKRFTFTFNANGSYTISIPYSPKEDSDSESDDSWYIIKIYSVYLLR